ncbi:MAG: hypothetical protein NTZ17_17195 [Phycisphaerae bacterium]|nr:hypothetical protein [Phycisphaerae bacterium]
MTMPMFLFQRIAAWFRRRRFTDEEYVEHVRKWKKRWKNARIGLLIGGLGLPTTLLINIERVLCLVRSIVDSNVVYWFTSGFQFGIVMGLGFCLGLAWLLLAITGALGERSKELMLKFHDDLKNGKQGETGGSL